MEIEAGGVAHGAQAGNSDVADGLTDLPFCHGTLDAWKSPNSVLVRSVSGSEWPGRRGMVKVTVVGTGAHWGHTATVVIQPDGGPGLYVGAKLGLLRVG